MKQVSRFARSAGIAAALVAAFTLATTAHADPAKCKAEIAKDAAKYVQAKAKALQKCHEAIVKAKLPPSTNCLTDPTASGKIAKADSKLRAGVAKQCGGADKTCSTTGDGNDSLASIGWPSACPNFENGSCNNAINNCDDISQCLICVGEAAVDQAISLYYDNLASGQFGNGSDINKCQVAIGKNAAKFLEAKNKALAKCEKGVLKGTVIGPCPDAAGATPAITKADSKKRAGICKACGGADKACGGGDDLTPAQIGFASSCPNVTKPSSSSCGGPIATLQDIVDCVDCVSEFKDDCLDPLSVPALRTYPPECNPAVGPTPCPTATPGIICPTQVVTDANGPAIDLDTGWTGQSHDAHAPTNNRLTLTVSGCAMPDSSTCGVCTTTGPIANPGGPAFNTHRCVLDTSIPCTVDGDCGANGPCSFFFGGPLPLSAGGVSVCVTNQVTAPITGTVDIEGGSAVNVIQLLSRVHTGPTLDKPCPNCIAGTCDSGPHASNPCVVTGHSNIFGDVSFDCPPSGGANVGNLPITLAYDTGTQTRTLAATNPSCRAPGFGSLICLGGSNNLAPCTTASECPGGVCQVPKCFCDTCNNAAATPCTSNADCVSAGATICGGRRCAGGANNGTPCNLNTECPGGGCTVPGAQTKPNDCDDSTCSSTMTCVGGVNDFLNCSVASDCPGGSCVSGNEGTCAVGPFELFCNPQETFRGCTTNADCPHSGDTCTLGKNRDCFLDNGVVGGTVTVTGTAGVSCGNTSSGSTGALFCVPPTNSGSVNSVSGLPGLGRVLLPFTATYN